MIRAPRIRPLAKPTRVLTPETRWVRKPSAIAGAASLVAARAVSREAWSMSELCQRRWRSPLDRGTDLIGLVGHAADGGDHDAGHQGEQTEDDQAGGEGGLDPVAFEGADRGFEDHGQHGREHQREHDLAHRGQRGDHDDRRRHEPDEAPRPDAELGNPAQRRRTPAQLRVASARPVAVSISVGRVSPIGGSRHTNRPPWSVLEPAAGRLFATPPGGVHHDWSPSRRDLHHAVGLSRPRSPSGCSQRLGGSSSVAGDDEGRRGMPTGSDDRRDRAREERLPTPAG